MNIYVGNDSKLHFVDSEGADSVLPFSSEYDYELSKMEGYALYDSVTFSFPAEIGSRYIVIVSCSAVNNGGWSNENYSFTNASDVKVIYFGQKPYYNLTSKYYGFCVFEVTADSTTVSFSKSFGQHMVNVIAFKIC